ncbi:Uncharacterised protein [Mycobacteroides abscessus subsp. abscessus]|nr:Uncharacterised protein [Mycobacteroides abscessus subsp. abscessus]
MSKPALWATRTAPRQNSRKVGSTDSMRGASQTMAVVIPVSCTICGGMARPGSIRVASSPMISPPRTLTAPISVMASQPPPVSSARARPPVVSRSTTTNVVSRSNASSRSKANWSVALPEPMT